MSDHSDPRDLEPPATPKDPRAIADRLAALPETTMRAAVLSEILERTSTADAAWLLDVLATSGRAGGPPFDLALLAFTLVTTVAVHAAGNLMNTLVDFKKGLDTESSSDLTLVSGDLQPKQVAMLIRRSYGIAALAAIPLCEKSDAPLLSLLGMLVAGAGSAYVYTGGPGLKYRALGDVLISTTFGPLLVAFAYVTQVHAFCVFSLYPRICSDRACVCVLTGGLAQLARAA